VVPKATHRDGLRAALAVAAVAVICALPADAQTPRVPAFEHVIVIVFENKELASVIGHPQAPNFTAYARRHARFTRFYGVTHPSLPNYIALVSGSTQGIRTNCTGCLVSARTLADTIEVSGRTWKTYAEGLPYPGFTGAVYRRYAKKHNPFVYFRNIATDPARRKAGIVPITQLARDLQEDALPDFSIVIPDMCNSMHDCPVRVGDAWLRRLVPRLARLPNTVVFVLFDEGTSNLRGGGHIPAFALGTAVQRGSRFSAVTNHYGVLRTIEEAWSLPLLGRSARTQPITGVWRESGG
jgi:phosphatidylinositol-3-phosphatase